MTPGGRQPDVYLPGQSLLHRTDARVKAALLIACLLTLGLLPVRAWLMYLIMAGLTAIALLLAELPLDILLRRALILELPLLLVLIPQIFLNGETGTAANESLRLLGWQLVFSPLALQKVLGILARSALSIQCAVLITATTRFEDLLGALHALGLPSMLMAILALMWRYLFVIMAEAQRMLQARLARSAGSSPPGLLWRARVTGGMLGALLLRSIQRSQRIFQAMQARGYNGRLILSRLDPLTNAQRLAVAAFAAGGAVLVLLARWMAVG